MLSIYFANYNKAWAYCNLRNGLFFSVFLADFFLFQALGHSAAPFETKIHSQIENKICYRNISQITIRPGLVVISEIAQLRYFAISLFRNFAIYNKPKSIKILE